MKKDLVSIAVPAYNHANYIDRCLDSIIAQSYENIELIIVNDGSTDDTAARIKARLAECEARFEKVVFIDKENEGIIKTFNKGARLATGKYLAICASDDAYTPDAIETLHDFLANNSDYVFAVGDNYIMDDNSQTCYWDAERKNVYDKHEAKYETFGQSLRDLRGTLDFLSDDFGTYSSFLSGNYIPNGYLFNREIFVDQIGGYSDDAPLEDLYLHLQMSKHGKYKYIDKPLFFYRWHDSNTVKQLEKMAEAESKTFDCEAEYARKAGLSDVYNTYRSKQGTTLKKLIPFILLIKEFYSAGKEALQVKLFGLNIFEKTIKRNTKTIKVLYIPVYKKKLNKK